MKKEYIVPLIRVEEIGTSYGVMADGTIENGGPTQEYDIIEAYSKEQGFCDEAMSIWEEEEDLEQ